MSFQYQYQPRSRSFLSSLLIFVLGGTAGWYMTTQDILPASTGDEVVVIDEETISTLSSETDMSLFWLVWSELSKKYVHEEALDPKQMVYGAIRGMVDSLDDPYTVYMPPSETKEFYESLEGELEGIGAELTVEEGVLVVVSPLKNSPAEKAGLLPGDAIVKIEEEFTSDLTLFEAIMQIRGEKGTSVTLTILREGLQDPFEVTIQRDKIDIDSVTVEKMDNGIVYLSVNQFNEKTNEEFSQAVSEMILEQPKGLIIDLRNNGGGYLDTAVDLLSFILPAHSDAVKLVARVGGSLNETMQTNGAPKLPEVPLVVLVNKGSASASEIVAGAVQDHKRGIVMGTTTFGKGTVQEVENFVDGSSIRMTIAKWLTPDGRDINKIGLEPDVVVETSEEDVENKLDTQKNAAVEYLLSRK